MSSLLKNAFNSFSIVRENDFITFFVVHNNGVLESQQ